MILLVYILLAFLCGGWVYCALSVVAAWRLKPRERAAVAAPSLTSTGIPGLSVLKPLAGAEARLEANLRTFFEQDDSNFELIFAVREALDPAVEVVHRLERAYPGVQTRLLVLGEPPYANAKVFSLSRMTGVAAHPWLVMSDSDVSVSRDFLSRVREEIAGDRYDLATCPYRAVPSPGPWSLFEALGLNSEFWSGVLVAKLIEGMRFTVGPTVIARREIFDRVPWESLRDYLAEDFVLGSRAASLGFRVDLSKCIVEHHIGGGEMRENFAHRLRWARSTRRSRPWGYLGQVFTNPLPVALLLTMADPRFWPAVPLTLLIRTVTAHSLSVWFLGDTLWRRRWYLLPIGDLLSFVFWLAGFSGNRITWRGQDYRLNRDGTFELVA